MKTPIGYAQWQVKFAIFAFLLHLFVPIGLPSQAAPWGEMCGSGSAETRLPDGSGNEKPAHAPTHCQTCCSQSHSPGLPGANLWQLATLPGNRYDELPWSVAMVASSLFAMAQARAPPMLSRS